MIEVLHVICDCSLGGAEKFVLSLCQSYPSHVQPKICSIYSGGELEGEYRHSGVMRYCCHRKRRRIDLSSTLRLARWISEADIVHTHLFAGHFWGRISTQIANYKGRKIPVVSTFHNTHFDSPFREKLLRKGMPLSDANVGVSNTVSSIIGPQTETIYCGIELKEFVTVKNNPKTANLIAIGRLVPQKGFDILLQALKHIEIPNLETHIIGDGPLFGELNSGQPSVKFHGYQKDIKPYLASAGIFVCPSRWEGLGLVLVEAMAAGVPVVASDIPICREVCGDAAAYAEAENPIALAKAITKVHKDPKLRTEMIRRGRIQVKGFSIETSAAKYTDLYAQLLSRD